MSDDGIIRGVLVFMFFVMWAGGVILECSISNLRRRIERLEEKKER